VVCVPMRVPMCLPTAEGCLSSQCGVCSYACSYVSSYCRRMPVKSVWCVFLCVFLSYYRRIPVKSVPWHISKVKPLYDIQRTCKFCTLACKQHRAHTQGGVCIRLCGSELFKMLVPRRQLPCAIHLPGICQAHVRHTLGTR
jgi:hypothetical protein